MIHGERVKQVREMLGLTQKELAARLTVTQPFIAQVENGWSKAPEDFGNALVFQTGFPLSFFEYPIEEGFPLGTLLFRAHADMSEREQKAVYRHSEMAYELVRRMSHHIIKTVAIRVPRFQNGPEEAAALTRSEFGLSPDMPVKNVIASMEEAGVLVVALPRVFDRADAFSAWAMMDGTAQRRPVVVLSSGRPADRLRMSAAHELGHLVMHQPVTKTQPEMEDEAKQFASAFLMPPEAMRNELIAPLTLDSFVNLKVKWGVSVSALIVRAHALGIITPRKYKTLFQMLSAKGWRIHEPLAHLVPLERPRAVRQIAEVLFGKPVDYSRLAKLVHYPESFVKELMEMHAGRSPKPTPVVPPSRSQPNASGLLNFSPKKRG